VDVGGGVLEGGAGGGSVSAATRFAVSASTM
jgi:hypothetical protein